MKLIVLLLSFNIITMYASAQPMLDEGSAWIYITVSTQHGAILNDGASEEDYIDTIFVAGRAYSMYSVRDSTLIDGRFYKKLWLQTISETYELHYQQPNTYEVSQERLVGYLREENNRVYMQSAEFDTLYKYYTGYLYALNPETPSIDYYFTLEGGDRIIYDFNKEQQPNVVPYVGSTHNLLFPYDELYLPYSKWSFPYIIQGSFLNLYCHNGHPVYKSTSFCPDPFFPDIVNSIEQSHTLSPHQDGNRIYNLQGQRTSRPTKGIHIIGGRKVLMK